MFADVKVGAFHPVLGLLDHIGDQTSLHGVVVVDLEALHYVLDLIATEHAHQVIFKGQEEAR